jgi:molybdopterin molybdotransferase
MLSVAEALQRLTEDVQPLSSETVPLAEAANRVLAADVAARLTQPPFPASSMDGYAVRRADLAALPATLKVIGVSAAGHPFAGALGPGEAVRIFTGATVPEGADHVIIQENVAAGKGVAEIREINESNSIREPGSDFRDGEILLRSGKRLSARDLMLAAQMNHAMVSVRRRPKVAILASGDELVQPGENPGDGQIVSSIPTALRALLAKAGAEPRPLGIARDTMESLYAHIAAAADADILVTIGGASVGDHDLVRAALEGAGFTIGFHKVAMRPGKPVMFGRRGDQRVLGLPGNPVSAIMCAYIFVLPLLAALTAEKRPDSGARTMALAVPLPANGVRQHYLRARIIRSNGALAVEPLPSQDSSLTAAFARADCLIVSPPGAAAAQPGDLVQVLPLDF